MDVCYFALLTTFQHIPPPFPMVKFMWKRIVMVILCLVCWYPRLLPLCKLSYLS